MDIPTFTSSASLFPDCKAGTQESSTSESATRTSNPCDQSASHLPTWPKTDNSPTTVPSPPGGLSAHIKKLWISPQIPTNPSTSERVSKLESRFNTPSDSASWRSPTHQARSMHCTKHFSSGSARNYSNKRYRKTLAPSSSGPAAAANLRGRSVLHQSQHCGCRTSTHFEATAQGIISRSFSTTCALHTCHCKRKFTW